LLSNFAFNFNLRRYTVAAVLAASADEVWPLQLVDLRDTDQVEELYQLLRLVPEVIDFYLNDYIFPKTARHQVGRCRLNP
jgi:hypothetical protein